MNLKNIIEKNFYMELDKLKKINFGTFRNFYVLPTDNAEKLKFLNYMFTNFPMQYFDDVWIIIENLLHPNFFPMEIVEDLIKADVEKENVVAIMGGGNNYNTFAFLRFVSYENVNNNDYIESYKKEFKEYNRKRMLAIL